MYNVTTTIRPTTTTDVKERFKKNYKKNIKTLKHKNRRLLHL